MNQKNIGRGETDLKFRNKIFIQIIFRHALTGKMEETCKLTSTSTIQEEKVVLHSRFTIYKEIHGGVL